MTSETAAARSPAIHEADGVVCAGRKRRGQRLVPWLGWLTVLASAGIGPGCGSSSQMWFYQHYAGTCQVLPKADRKPEATSDLRVATAKAAFVRTLDEHAKELRDCYVNSLQYGETHGTVRLDIAIDHDGRAQPVRLLADTTGFPPLACCVIDVVRRVPFDPALATAGATFEYPFSFHTLRTTTVQGFGVPWSQWRARDDGFLAELDESTVVIGGTILYTLAPDRIHYATDVEETPQTQQTQQTSGHERGRAAGE